MASGHYRVSAPTGNLGGTWPGEPIARAQGWFGAVGDRLVLEMRTGAQTPRLDRKPHGAGLELEHPLVLQEHEAIVLSNWILMGASGVLVANIEVAWSEYDR